MQPCATLLVLCLGAQPCLASLPPHREMRSDGHFMDKDYPSDVRAKVTKYHTKYDFDHPYPILQESADYDADFVKDENDDGGEWNAQENYDYLRHAILKHKELIEKLKGKLADDEKSFKENQTIEAKLEAESKASDSEFEAAKKVADLAQAKVDDLKAQVAEAQAAVDKEMIELTDCRKELVNAKRHLEAEVQKHRDAETSPYLDGHGHLEKIHENVDIVEKAEAAEAAGEETVAVSKKDLLRVQKAHEEALAKVKKTEALLEEAAAKLKRFRQAEDPDGGVYYVNEMAGKKSAASTLRYSTVVYLIAVAMGACLN